jgi:hypothetical protein
MISLQRTKKELLTIFSKLFFILMYDYEQMSYSSLIYIWCVPDNEMMEYQKYTDDGEDMNDAGNAEDSQNINKKKGVFWTDPTFANNPLVRTYWSIKYHIRCLSTIDSDPEIEVEDETPPDVLKTMIKGDICDILKSFQNRRTDFLISNFLSWFKKRGKELVDRLQRDPSRKDELITEMIEKEVADTLLPNVWEINDPQIDKQFNFSKNFTKYCDADDFEEVPDIS